MVFLILGRILFHGAAKYTNADDKIHEIFLQRVASTHNCKGHHLWVACFRKHNFVELDVVFFGYAVTTREEKEKNEMYARAGPAGLASMVAPGGLRMTSFVCTPTSQISLHKRLRS